jgi:hypothetical protein
VTNPSPRNWPALYYPEQLGSKGKTPAQTLYAAIVNDERDNPNSSFVKVGTRPYRYFLKELANSKRRLRIIPVTRAREIALVGTTALSTTSTQQNQKLACRKIHNHNRTAEVRLAV